MRSWLTNWWHHLSREDNLWTPKMSPSPHFSSYYVWLWRWFVDIHDSHCERPFWEAETSMLTKGVSMYTVKRSAIRLTNVRAPQLSDRIYVEAVAFASPPPPRSKKWKLQNTISKTFGAVVFSRARYHLRNREKTSWTLVHVWNEVENVWKRKTSFFMWACWLNGDHI